MTKKYNTSNPHELADAEELGTINGYYNKPIRMKQIHINQDLSNWDAKFTCAHELGHAILHPNASAPFMRSKTSLSLDKL